MKTCQRKADFVHIGLHLNMIFLLQSYIFSCIMLRNSCNRQKKRTKAYNTHYRGCTPLFYIAGACGLGSF